MTPVSSSPLVCSSFELTPELATPAAASLQKFYLILAILYFVCVAMEIFGFVATFLSRLRLVSTYFLISVVVGFIVTASEIVRLVVHFHFKVRCDIPLRGFGAAELITSSGQSDIISSCVADQLAENTPGDTITSE